MSAFLKISNLLMVVLAQVDIYFVYINIDIIIFFEEIQLFYTFFMEL